MRIVRTALPTAGTPLAIVECLGESWYLKGLTVADIAELVGARPKDLEVHLDNLEAQGLVRVKDQRRLGYVITERAKELLDARRRQV